MQKKSFQVVLSIVEPSTFNVTEASGPKALCLERAAHCIVFEHPADAKGPNNEQSKQSKQSTCGSVFLSIEVSPLILRNSPNNSISWIMFVEIRVNYLVCNEFPWD